MNKSKQYSYEQRMHDREEELNAMFKDLKDKDPDKDKKRNPQRVNIQQLLNEWEEKKERDHFTNEVSPKIVDEMEKEALEEGISSYSVKNQKGNTITYTVTAEKSRDDFTFTYSIEDSGARSHRTRNEFLKSLNRTAVNSIVGTVRETVSRPFREKDQLIDRCMC